jgi:rhodanese-related sulfurtransferase
MSAVADIQPIPELLLADVQRAVARGAIVVDGRSPETYEAGHIPGSLNVPMDADGFAERSLAVLEHQAPVIAVGTDDVDSGVMGWMLADAGFAAAVRIGGGGVRRYQSAGYGVDRHTAVGGERLLSDLRLGGVVLVDVREDEEWRSGHVPGSVHVPLRELAAAERVLPRAPIVVACADGIRAATAASALRRFGHANVWRVAGRGIPYFLSRRVNLGLCG